MKPFIERAADVVQASQIAVHVLLSQDNDDLEFCRYGGMLSADEFTARKLRSVGIIGLRGLQPLSAFKEPLAPRVVDAIASAFLAYVQTLLGQRFREHTTTAEIQELERLYTIPDTRPYPHSYFA